MSNQIERPPVGLIALDNKEGKCLPYLQVGFSVRGLVPPETELLFDNMLIKQKTKSKDAMVFFKVPLEKTEERSQIEYRRFELTE